MHSSILKAVKGPKIKVRKEMPMPHQIVIILCILIVAIFIYAIILKKILARKTEKENQIKQSLSAVPEITDYHLEYKGKTSHQIDRFGKYEMPDMTWREWLREFEQESHQWKKYDASRISLFVKNMNFVITDIETNGIHGYMIELPCNLVNMQKMILSPQKVAFNEDCDGQYIYGYDNDRGMSCIYCFGKDNGNNERHGVITESMLKRATINPDNFKMQVQNNIVTILKDISCAMY